MGTNRCKKSNAWHFLDCDDRFQNLHIQLFLMMWKNNISFALSSTHCSFKILFAAHPSEELKPIFPLSACFILGSYHWSFRHKVHCYFYLLYILFVRGNNLLGLSDRTQVNGASFVIGCIAFYLNWLVLSSIWSAHNKTKPIIIICLLHISICTPQKMIALSAF